MFLHLPKLPLKGSTMYLWLLRTHFSIFQNRNAGASVSLNREAEGALPAGNPEQQLWTLMHSDSKWNRIWVSPCLQIQKATELQGTASFERESTISPTLGPAKYSSRLVFDYRGLGAKASSCLLTLFNECSIYFLSSPVSQTLSQHPCPLPHCGIQTVCTFFSSYIHLPSRIPPSPSPLLPKPTFWTQTQSSQPYSHCLGLSHLQVPLIETNSFPFPWCPRCYEMIFPFQNKETLGLRKIRLQS